MKTLVTKILMTLLLNAFAFASIVAAEDVILPVIFRPEILQEGVQRDLTPAQIAELLPWAHNSKVELKELLENVKQLSAEGKVERLVEGIELVIKRSAHKNSELLMRYVLTRSLVLNNILDEEMDSEAVGSVDVKLRILSTSIAMALDYSNDDVLTLTNNNKIRYAMFGKVYYSFLYELNKSIFDASAQYKIQKTALEWFQWDLYRDVDNQLYAALIIKINNALKLYPSHELKDAEAMKFIRQMKSFSVYSELSDKMLVHETIASSREKKSKDKFVVGDRVILMSPPEIGKITKVLSKDRYNFITDSGHEFKKMDRDFFYETKGCGDGYCVNDELIYKDILKTPRHEKGIEVTIVGVAAKDDYYVFKYKSKNGYKLFETNAYNLYQIKGCRNNLCIGDKVSIKSDPDGIVEIVQLGASNCGVKYVGNRYLSFGSYYNYDANYSYDELIR